jgi:poly(3-hydroxybutyrate) depolymerase
MRKIFILLLLNFILVSVFSVNVKVSNDITVSGLSSGGYMSPQVHISFSSKIRGSGVFAGGPYYCAKGNTMTALTTCMSGYGIININGLIKTIKDYEQSGKIDSISNIKDSKVYIYSGSGDTTVNPKVSKEGEKLYKALGADIKSEYSIKAKHAMPTESYGNPCETSKSPFINKCGFNGALEALNHLFNGQIVPGKNSYKENFYKMKQNVSLGSSMGPNAFLYVPKNCLSKNCPLHIVFHGCKQTLNDIGMKYVQFTGYNEIAEANDIVLLYPQAVSSMMMPSNPNGCWDWFGYTDSNYANKEGKQMKIINNLMDSLLNGVEITSLSHEELESESIE